MCVLSLYARHVYAMTTLTSDVSCLCMYVPRVRLVCVCVCACVCVTPQAENPAYEAWLAAPKVKGAKRELKHIDLMLHGVWGPGVKGKLDPEGLTATGAAQVSMRVLRSVW